MPTVEVVKHIALYFADGLLDTTNSKFSKEKFIIIKKFMNNVSMPESMARFFAAVGMGYKGLVARIKGDKPKSDVSLPKPIKKYLKRGDFVESKNGQVGRVMEIYKSVKTEEKEKCAVIWNNEYKGQKLSLMPVEDKGTEFNPEIRKVL